MRAGLSDSHMSGGSASTGPEGKQMESDVAAARVVLQKSIRHGLIRGFLLPFHLPLACMSARFGFLICFSNILLG